MCLKDALAQLRGDGICVSESRLRSAIRSGKITRPPVDGSGRFVFGERHLDELRTLFGAKEVSR
jgi:hypothetical protein